MLQRAGECNTYWIFIYDAQINQFPFHLDKMEVSQTTLPCLASKHLFEASDWTLAAGAVLETLMQHQKWFSSLHTEAGWTAKQRSHPVCQSSQTCSLNSNFPTFEDLSKANYIKPSREIR